MMENDLFKLFAVDILNLDERKHTLSSMLDYFTENEIKMVKRSADIIYALNKELKDKDDYIRRLEIQIKNIKLFHDDSTTNGDEYH